MSLKGGDGPRPNHQRPFPFHSKILSLTRRRPVLWEAGKHDHLSQDLHSPFVFRCFPRDPLFPPLVIPVRL